ncbi:PAS domain S-box protein [Oceanidesulfovibrio marinus]|uniref:histidine kinase n=1 Tax=Oceanidesulfovibrio marinus TaxID=370038 RepID=A0A6P1ZKH6_9BACT|nr:PAS domain S-box protein [Oceanidesulfovibrio marinus]TVM35810.1 hypothetical protein DQK91_03875 [Oceanidesulfovibrio marinus]
MTNQNPPDSLSGTMTISTTAVPLLLDEHGVIRNVLGPVPGRNVQELPGVPLADLFDPAAATAVRSLLGSEQGGAGLACTLTPGGETRVLDLYRWESGYLALLRPLCEPCPDSGAAQTRYPMDNPHPVLSASVDGEIRFANPPAMALLNAMRTAEDNPHRVPSCLLPQLKDTHHTRRRRDVEMPVGNTVYMLSMVPVAGENHVHVYGLDITARIRAERALARSHEELEARVEDRTRSLTEQVQEREKAEEALRLASLIVEESPVILFRRSADEERTLLYVSKNIARFGVTAEDMLAGRVHFSNLIHPDDKERLRAEVDHHANERTSEYTQEYRILTPQGETRWVHDETRAEPDANGEICHYQGIVVDITERKKAEIALAMAKTIVERSPVVLFRRSAGTDGRLLYVSENVSRFGYSAADFMNGRTEFVDMVHPDDRERLSRDVARAAEKKLDQYYLTYRIRTASGDVRYIDDLTSVERGEDGEPRFYQGVLNDVTEKALAQKELKKSEYKYRRIVETAGEGFLLMDRDLVITDVNAAYCQMLGYTRKEILGLTPFDLATERHAAFMEANRHTLLSQEYRTFEGSVVAKDGREVPILAHGNTLNDDKGRLIGNVAFVTDLTEQKKALALAEEVQKSLQPASPFIQPGLIIASRSVASQSVGGDYLDVLTDLGLGESSIAIVVGDISGHGVDSALLMTSARAFMRMRAARGGTISEIVDDMNRSLAQDMSQSGRFMTLFFLAVEPKSGRMVWIRAGHDPALIYDIENDSFDELRGFGLPLGVEANFLYQENVQPPLPPGRLVVIGSDGIWEATNPEHEMFGKDRLRQVVRRYAADGPEAVVKNVFNEVYLFSRGVPLEDDMTLAVLQLGGVAGNN